MVLVDLNNNWMLVGMVVGVKSNSTYDAHGQLLRELMSAWQMNDT